ncbi:MAG: hypothetical protein RR540_02655 [Oscillospiraceae bacterium]
MNEPSPNKNFQEMLSKYKSELMGIYATNTAKITPQKVFSEPSPAKEIPADDECPDDKSCGFLQVEVTTAGGNIPIRDAQVSVYEIIDGEKILHNQLFTDQSGRTKPVTLAAPEKSLSEIPDSPTLPYATYNVKVRKDGFYPVEILGVQVFDTIKSIQPVGLIPLMEFEENPNKEIIHEIGKNEL